MVLDYIEPSLYLETRTAAETTSLKNRKVIRSWAGAWTSLTLTQTTLLGAKPNNL